MNCKIHRNLLPGALFLLLVLSKCTTEKEPVKSLLGEQEMVVTAHPAASEIGAEILKKGGNAYDAAIAVQFALAVCYPAAGNIGGGGFLVFRKENGEVGTLDFREKAPAAAHPDMYLDSAGNALEELSKFGQLAVGIPGTVAGMAELHKKMGTIPWAELVQPSVDLAKNGVILTEKEAARLNQNRSDFIKYNPGKTYFIKKEGWKSGDTLKQADLSKALARIRDNGFSGFYEGETADLIVAECKSGNGIITHTDLKNYTSVWRDALIGEYKNHKIIAMPPPSSGGVCLLQMLKCTEPFDLKSAGFQTPKTVHTMTEVERRSYADRAVHLGDPDFYDVPVSNLLDKEYLSSRMNDFSADKATDSENVLAGKFAPPESEQTTHYSIVDKWGNAAAITTTLNGGYGSKVTVKGGGFFLNNEMDDFSIKPGTPNMYGLLGGEANAAEPGKRMLSSMTPTIVEKDGTLFLVAGTPGGSTIITSVFQIILNIIEHGMTAQEAVSAPRFHHQWQPNIVFREDDALSPETVTALEKMGHTVDVREPIGRTNIILVLPDGKLEGAADPRGDDAAAGQ